ncbi:MAG TPA: hypothetical protein VFQ65_07710 [Kofleriaceae bacterium]|nr:hypothetical protein [Kofleriaceae bacterium]
MRLSRNTVLVRQRAAVACCIALALASGLGLGLIVRAGRRPLAAHAGKPERQLLIEIERMHASACDEVRGAPGQRRASAEEAVLLSQIREITQTIHGDLSALEAEAIRFTHVIDRVATGTSSASERDDLLAELDGRRDAFEREVQAVMSIERATLRAERADAIDSLGRLRIVLGFVSVLGLLAGILLAILAWTVPPIRRPPIDVIATVQPGTPEKDPELLH